MSKHIDELGIYIGVFLISAATLALEISLTRVFSVAQWHHFAFMVISIGLFGFGASGSFLAVFGSLLKKDTNKMLVLFSLLFSLCFGGLVVWKSADYAIAIWQAGQTLDVLPVPQAPFRFIVVFGALLLCVTLFMLFVGEVTKALKRS